MDATYLPNPPNAGPTELHRPHFHFLPARNWMNDPNGLIQWNGRFHLFYQYNPNGPFHGTIHWGHAVSDDLVHWQHLPVALAPTSGGADADGCWSGCAVDNGGVPTLVYSGIHPQVVCLATSDDDELLTWHKHPANPVIAGPPEALGAHTGGQFRDPFIWRADGRWHMVMGSKIEGEGGLVLRYRSHDLINWEYCGILLKGDARQTKPFWSGTVWECPNFFHLDDRHVLILSAQAEPNQLLYAVYYTGRFDGERFMPNMERILVHGSTFYAPQIMRLADGRTVMWGWLKEGRRQTTVMEAGWAGTMSVPIELTARSDGSLGLAPAAELKRLRRTHWRFDNLTLTPGSSSLLDDIQGDCLELEVVFEPEGSAAFGLRLRCSPDGAEHTSVLYDSVQERLVVDPSVSSLSTVVDRDIHKAPLSLDEQGRLRLHIFLDRSVLEVFGNGHTCLASRIYPSRPDSLGLDLFAGFGHVQVISMDIWTLASVWQ